jgi:glucose-1-phosphate thymidylyltransferase
MKVLILAAGYGTRLYPLVKDTPKPLLKIGEKPLINFLLEKIAGLKGLSEVLVVTNNKFANVFRDWAKDHKRFKVPVTIINDGTETPDDRLGSVGDINFVLENEPIKEDLLVIGGDNLFDYDLSHYLAFAQKKDPHITIGVYDINDLNKAQQFGVVVMDKEGQVISFEEKPQSPSSSVIAMCFYYFPQASLKLVREYLKQSKKTDNAGNYIQWLSEKSKVYGYKFEGKWYDIGSIESYFEAQERFKEK